MLLVLAKEIYECWLVAENIILLGGGGEGGGWRGEGPLRSQRHLEISNEMESFPSYGSRVVFIVYS